MVLDALVTVLTGETPRRVEHAVQPLREFAPAAVPHESDSTAVECEVMYDFEAPDKRAITRVLWKAWVRA